MDTTTEPAKTKHNPPSWVDLTIMIRADSPQGMPAARDYKFGMCNSDFHKLMWLIMNQLEDMILEIIDMAATHPDDIEEEA